MGVVSGSNTLISTDCMPFAGPFVALKIPSYDKNSTTTPLLSTRANPSGDPFCSIPLYPIAPYNRTPFVTGNELRLVVL
jgi:hypothetical protein